MTASHGVVLAWVIFFHYMPAFVWSQLVLLAIVRGCASVMMGEVE